MKYGLEKDGKANITLKQKQEGILNIIALRQKDVMSSEYFTRASLYLVRLKIFEWVKFHRRHLHQIQGNRAGRNFVTASRMNSRLMITYARIETEMNLKMDSTFE